MSKGFLLPRGYDGATLAVPAEDANTRAGTTTIHEIGQRGIAVAEAIASAEDLNHHCAEMSMRNLAGLMNRVDASDYAGLPGEDREELLVTAQDTFSFLYGGEAADEMREVVELTRPTNVEEAELRLTQAAFNRLQLRVSIGPRHQSGYTPEEEPTVRDFTRRYAQVFSSTFFGLSTTGSRLTSDPRELAYVVSTINAAVPGSLG